MNLLSDIRGWRRGVRTHRRLRDLTGSLVVVTGAGSGIGREIALAFATAGAIVAVADLDLDTARETAALINTPRPDGGGALAVFGGGAYAYRVNVAVESEVQRFAAELRDHHGVADVVVNNAGIGYAGTFTETPQDEFAHVMDVNFWGVVYGCRAFAEQMIDHGTGGHLVNVASVAAYTPQRGLTAYATSKAAVVMLSECLRAELIPHGIGVSAICPGLVSTNLARTTDFAGATPEERRAKQERLTAFHRRRNFTPDRVATEIVQSVRKNRGIVSVTPESGMWRWLSRHTPSAIHVGARLDLE